MSHLCQDQSDLNDDAADNKTQIIIKILNDKLNCYKN